MPDAVEYTTCRLCNRIVEKEHVNSSGRCEDCAGQRAEEEADEEK